MDAKKLLLSIAFSLLFGCNQLSSKDAEFFAANFSLSSCVQNAGDLDALESFMSDGMKIKQQLSPNLSKYFLGGSDGKAWSFTSPDGSYSVAYRDDGLCTVFIKEMNVHNYILHLNKTLTRLSEQLDWKPSVSEIPMFAGEEQLKNFDFSILLPDKEVRVFISAVNKVTGNYQVAFSASKL